MDPNFSVQIKCSVKKSQHSKTHLTNAVGSQHSALFSATTAWSSFYSSKLPKRKANDAFTGFDSRNEVWTLGVLHILMFLFAFFVYPRNKEKSGSQPASLDHVLEKRFPLKAHQSESYLLIGTFCN